MSLPPFLVSWAEPEAVNEDGRDADGWLDPILRGGELHALYAATLGKCRDEKRKPALLGRGCAASPAKVVSVELKDATALR